jgi:hypothetical protein
MHMTDTTLLAPSPSAPPLHRAARFPPNLTHTSLACRFSVIGAPGAAVQIADRTSCHFMDRNDEVRRVRLTNDAAM